MAVILIRVVICSKKSYLCYVQKSSEIGSSSLILFKITLATFFSETRCSYIQFHAVFLYVVSFKAVPFVHSTVLFYFQRHIFWP